MDAGASKVSQTIVPVTVSNILSAPSEHETAKNSPSGEIDAHLRGTASMGIA